MNTRTMAQPTTNTTDWTILGVIWGICISIITICMKWIDSHFAARKLEREMFIKTVVNEAMTASLSEVKNDIKQLFEYREADRTHIDEKFSKLMTEVRK